MKWASIVLGAVIAVTGLMVFMSSQDALSELDRGVQSASDIPLVGWITGALAESDAAEARKGLLLSRTLGIAVMAFGGLLLLAGLVTGKGKH